MNKALFVILIFIVSVITTISCSKDGTSGGGGGGTPVDCATLTSGIGTNNQTLCINNSITNITYTTNGVTGVNFSGLPSGVTGNWTANVVTISGTPSVSGVFNYTVTLTGGCNNTTATGTITIVNNAFAADVNPIIQSSCNQAGCHAAGSTNGPGPLTNHAQVFASRVAVRSAIASGRMPQGGGLSIAQKNSIICWIDSGAPNN